MPNREFRSSFTVRVFRSFVFFVILVSIVLTLFFIYSEERAARHDLMEQGMTLSTLLAYNARTGVFAENRDLLLDPVRGILSQENVKEVSVYSADRRVLMRERKKDPDQRGAQGTEQTVFVKPGDVMQTTVRDTGDALEILSPVTIETFADEAAALYYEASPVKEQKIVGYVRVLLDKGVLRREEKLIVERSGAIAAIFLLVGSLFIFIMTKRVMRPLLSLTDAVHKVGAGEPVEKLPIETSDEVGRLAVAFNDMSDNLRKREEEKAFLEEKLRHAQKMEAVGTLARGIAHDFNNILSTVQGSLYIIQKKLSGESPLKVYTEQIGNSLAKAKHLINSLLAFSRSYKSHPLEVDVNRLITKMHPLLATVLRGDIELRLLLSEETLIIWADSLQIEQVILNLCTNARDALAGAGTVMIKTAAVIAGPEATGDRDLPPGQYCLITVSDDGAGMDEETRQRIFEPFYTTKEVGKGTGLGLSIVYGIVEQHKGIIGVSSRKGEGTAFSIFLPLHDPSGVGHQC